MKSERKNGKMEQEVRVLRLQDANGCAFVAPIVNQLVRIVNKSPFYTSTVPHHATLV